METNKQFQGNKKKARKKAYLVRESFRKMKAERNGLLKLAIQNHDFDTCVKLMK